MAKLEQMLRCTNITKRFGPKTLLEDISFAIHPGEKIGLIGRNGHGKSTLLRLITGEDEPNLGEIQIPKDYKVGTLGQFLDFTADTVRSEAMIINQSTLDPSFKKGGRLTLNDNEPLPFSKGERKRDFFAQETVQPWQAEKMLFGLGFSAEQVDQSPDQLSGGFQIRLQLAKLLLSDPDLLILDEPTNYLDIVSIRWLEQFLQSWRKELLVVSHDQRFLESVITHTIGIHRRGIQKIKGSPQAFYRKIREQEDHHERTRIQAEKKAKKTEKFIREFRAGARSAGLVQSRIKMLAKQPVQKKLPPLPTIEFEFKSLPFQGDTLVRVNNISFGYESGQTLFSGLSFQVEMGDRIAIVGPNGHGKSTLLNVLAAAGVNGYVTQQTQNTSPFFKGRKEEGFFEKQSSLDPALAKGGNFIPHTGNIKYHQRTEIGYFSQLHKTSLESDKTIFETLRNANSQVTDEDICQVCGNLLFHNDDRHKKIAVLSGGEKSRVNLGKILLEPHHLLLLDEPTNHFDLESVQALGTALKHFPGAVIFVSHDESLIHTVADKLIVFDEGDAFVYERTYGEFLAEKGWSTEAEINTGQKKNTSEQKVDYKAQKELQKKLRPHLRAQQTIEDKITAIEDDIAGLTAQIKTATTKGNILKADTLLQTKLKKEAELLPLYVQLEEIEQQIMEIQSS